MEVKEVRVICKSLHAYSTQPAKRRGASSRVTNQ
jgi:hypothetical protein